MRFIKCQLSAPLKSGARHNRPCTSRPLAWLWAAAG